MMEHEEDYNSDEESHYDGSYGDVTSFRDINFQSETMRNILKLSEPDYDDRKKQTTVDYNSGSMFPQWILENPDWQSTRAKNKDNSISDILQIPFTQRSQEQSSTLIHWLMSVWEIANMMGFKRCGAMTQVFNFITYEPGEDIIVEGERGLTFYIIISGTAQVHKNGIGVVASLTTGQSFGEIALTQGKDLRSATVRAQTKVEVLSLHKVDYDRFVKDIQLAERRENFQILRSCKLLSHWSRGKVQKMCNLCSRKIYNPGEYVFRQGDEPDYLYFVVEGVLSVVKEVHIVVKNRWPTGLSSWESISRKKIKPFVIKDMLKGSYFGELSIIQNTKRKASIVAKTRCTLLALDRLEFIHLLKNSKTRDEVAENAREYTPDDEILDRVNSMDIGSSTNNTTAQLNDLQKQLVKPTRSRSRRRLRKRCSSTAPDSNATPKDDPEATRLAALNSRVNKFRAQVSSSFNEFDLSARPTSKGRPQSGGFFAVIEEALELMRREKQDEEERKRLELETQQLKLKKVKIYSSNMLRREQSMGHLKRQSSTDSTVAPLPSARELPNSGRSPRRASTVNDNSELPPVVTFSPVQSPATERSRRNSQVTLKFPSATAATPTIGTVTAVVRKDPSGRLVKSAQANDIALFKSHSRASHDSGDYIDNEERPHSTTDKPDGVTHRPLHRLSTL